MFYPCLKGGLALSMRKVLFIDRDGTLIVEPESDKQVDSLEKLEFIPNAISALRLIAQTLSYELVIVTNQDGLGTRSFPMESFIPAHEKMLTTFKNEGVVFNEVLIDKSFPEDNAPTRKPRTGLLTKYLSNEFDLSRSFVIGDRLTDVELAKNLGAQAIYFSTDNCQEAALSTTDWQLIAKFLREQERKSLIKRKTAETDVEVELALDGCGEAQIETGISFFDHMLTQIAKHSGCNLKIKVRGDLHVDEHHTIEDTGIALGEAVCQALSNKKGIARYGFLLPMDDCLAQVAIDFSNRPWIVWDALFQREKIGEMPTEMFFHFFKSFSDAAKCNLNIKAEGTNEHHKIESIFKAFAKTLGQAWKLDYQSAILPSTKESL